MKMKLLTLLLLLCLCAHSWGACSSTSFRYSQSCSMALPGACVTASAPTCVYVTESTCQAEFGSSNVCPSGTYLSSTTTNKECWGGTPSWGGTDDYGFGVLPAGYYYNSSYNVGSSAGFWTITESGDGSAYDLIFNTGATMLQNTDFENLGTSVRLVKDSE